MQQNEMKNMRHLSVKIYFSCSIYGDWFKDIFFSDWLENDGKDHHAVYLNCRN
jgi:hypothetical protein